MNLSNECLAFIRPIVSVCRQQFPKKCGSCNKAYTSFEDFIRATQPIGVPAAFNEGDDPFGILSYVNCSCGSTLLLQCEEMAGDTHRRFNEMLAAESSRLGVTPRDILLELRAAIRTIAEKGVLP